MSRYFWFVFFIMLVWGSGLWFGGPARGADVVILLVRKHELGGKMQLSFFWECWWQIYEFVGGLIAKADRLIPLFPTFIRVAWWKKEFVFVFVWLPVLLILARLLSEIKSKKVKAAFLTLVVLYWLPLKFWSESLTNNFIIRTGFDWRLPWSDDFVWIWSDGEEKSGQTYFEYEWWQKKKAKQAVIKLSCLGHYQLLFNEKTIYRGPLFGVLPEVYYDEIDLSAYVKQGQNKLSVVCEYLDLPVHEYEFYQQPGLLVGGYIDDGGTDHNLADNRLWQAAYMTGVENKNRISSDAGFAKKIDLSKEKPILAVSKKKEFPYKLLPRPLDLLEHKQVEISKPSNNVWNLDRFMPGYLVLSANVEERCEIDVYWGAELEKDGFVKEYSGQRDSLILPEGKTKWEQFSRRAGRFIGIKSDDCVGDFDLSFGKTGMPFEKMKRPVFENKMDEAIYQVSLNTLENNIQDHFEDCVEREKAMYLGDVLAMSKCLAVDGKNLDLIAEMIEQFARDQNDDGSFPSMTPSGVNQLIPAYALQWPVLLELYLRKGGDIKLAQKMYPALTKLLTWAKNNQSPEGFLYNKQKAELWWSFIDWTKTDDSLFFSTPLQIWYVAALQSAVNIFVRIDRDNVELKNRLAKLRPALIDVAYIKHIGVFADSFEKPNQSRPSLVTNALAGKFGLFANVENSRRAIAYFKTKLSTDSPFSQTWVIEWLITANEKRMAEEILRFYWGGMVDEGATAVFERYRISGEEIDRGTYSHAWGCGPIHLYKELDF